MSRRIHKQEIVHCCRNKEDKEDSPDTSKVYVDRKVWAQQPKAARKLTS